MQQLASTAEAVALDGDLTSAPGRRHAIRVIAYWVCTAVIVWEMVAGSMWDLLRIEFVRGVFAQLGYPLYLLSIIGVWKLPCAVALVVPRFPRLKEWAYAGAFFNYSGAVASHILGGQSAARWWLGPAVFAAMTLVSWGLRPPDRRLPRNPQAAPLRPIAWIVPLGAIVLFLALALLTLPKGPPPA